jgi:hypothetical protein
MVLSDSDNPFGQMQGVNQMPIFRRQRFRPDQVRHLMAMFGPGTEPTGAPPASDDDLSRVKLVQVEHESCSVCQDDATGEAA